MYLRFCVVEWMFGVSMIVQKGRSVKCCCGIAAILRAACANKKRPGTSSSSWGGGIATSFRMVSLSWSKRTCRRHNSAPGTSSSSWGGVFCLCNLVEKDVPKAQIRPRKKQLVVGRSFLVTQFCRKESAEGTTLHHSTQLVVGRRNGIVELVEKDVPKALIRRQPCWSAWF